MGEVYEARDPRLDRTVALKLVSDAAGANEMRRARLLQEARAVSALHHPNIVTVYDVLQHESGDVVVMEFVRGKTLDEIIPKRGLRLSQALAYAIPIADALTAAHRAGIIHRDLKPANVMVDDSGVVKLLDFGLAKSLAFSATADGATRSIVAGDTAEGTIVGTVSYMSPEQAQGKPVDARTDIFSFGCMLYEMVTGRRPFDGDSQMATLSAILKDQPRPASDSSEGIPLEVDRIIARCLRKDPERRWQSIADVRVALLEIKEESESGTLEAAEAPVKVGRRKRRWTSAAIAAAIGIAVAGFWWNSAREGEAPLAPVQLTSYPGFETDPALSPDGKQVAFTWDGDDQTTEHIYVKLVGTTDALRLTKDPRPEHHPAWSRDGRWIAFIRELEGGRGSIVVTSALGGAERKISETPNCCSTLSWSPDGKWLAGAEGDSNDPTVSKLVLIRVDTGDKRYVKSGIPGRIREDGPAFSPSGRALAFSASYINDSGTPIYVLRLAEDMTPANPAIRLTNPVSIDNQPVWTPDGREIVYASGLGWRGTLWRIRADGRGQPRQLAFAPLGSAQPSISLQAGRLAYTISSQYVNIWRRPVGVSTQPPSKVAASTRDDFSPAYSPDGTRLVFSSTRTGFDEIWSANADASNAQQLTRFGRGVSGSPKFAPDGNRIAFDSNVTGVFEIYTVPADGGNPVQLTHTGAASYAPNWSRDGKSLYFACLKTGRREVWKIPAAGGDAVQVTRDGGIAASESPDGSEVYYTKEGTGGPLWKMPAGGGPETKMLDDVLWRDFAPGKSALYYITHVSGPTCEIRRLPYTGGAYEVLGKADFASAGLAVSPDERWMAYAVAVSNGSDLMLVENFR
jgi:Tol biopolymer transport system component